MNNRELRKVKYVLGRLKTIHTKESGSNVFDPTTYRGIGAKEELLNTIVLEVAKRFNIWAESWIIPELQEVVDDNENYENNK